MSFTDMTFSFEAMRWIVLTAIGIYAWFIGRQSASSAELLELRTRLTTLEAQMAQVPSQSQLHELVATVATAVRSPDWVVAVQLTASVLVSTVPPRPTATHRPLVE